MVKCFKDLCMNSKMSCALVYDPNRPWDPLKNYHRVPLFSGTPIFDSRLLSERTGDIHDYDKCDWAKDPTCKGEIVGHYKGSCEYKGTLVDGFALQ